MRRWRSGSTAGARRAARFTCIDRFKSLTECRRALPEMAALPVAVQRGTLKRLDEAYRAFFRRVKTGGPAGFPRFHSRRRFDSLSVVSGMKVEEDRPRLPGFGWMTARRRGDNPYPGACPGPRSRGKPVSAVLRRSAGHWSAVVCCRVEAPGREDDGTAIDLDTNAGQVAASDGRLFHSPDTSRLEARAKRLSRRLARQKRGSGHRERMRTRLAKTRRLIAGKRRHWQHRTSPTLADAAHTVVLEDLKVLGMTRNARGTALAPARHVRQKAGLNRVILYTGWVALRHMLAYEAGPTVAVHLRNTSRPPAFAGVLATARKCVYLL